MRSQLSAAGNLPFDSLQSPIQEVSVRVAIANANTGIGKVLQEAEPVRKQICVDTSFSVVVEIEVLKEHEVRQRQRQWAAQDLLLGALDIHDKHTLAPCLGHTSARRSAATRCALSRAAPVGGTRSCELISPLLEMNASPGAFDVMSAFNGLTNGVSAA